METKKKILVVDDETPIRLLLRDFLESAGYAVSLAPGGEEALEIISREVPDLVILDVNMNGMSGFEVCRHIRNDYLLANLPVIMLTVDAGDASQVKGLSSGANDYIAKPIKFNVLTARVSALLRGSANALDSNPLSGLPGNASIARELDKRLNAGAPFDMVMADLDNFKALNDFYGFVQGDRIIKLTSAILVQTLKKCSPEDYFVGHIGGDDFVAICSEGDAEKCCREIIKEFDAAVPGYYSPEDRMRGYIVVKDRRGVESKFPVVSISLAVVSNHGRRFTHAGEVSSALAELKKYVKQIPGSNYAVDKRKISKRILVVDDNYSVASMIGDSMVSLGYETKVLVSGKMIVETAKSWRPQVITLDVIMPPPDGIECLSKLKEDPDTRDIPVVIVSGIAQDPKVQTRLSGAQAVLDKPVEMELFSKTLSKTVENLTSPPLAANG